jgi:PAS domain S-box-containing protein
MDAGGRSAGEPVRVLHVDADPGVTERVASALDRDDAFAASVAGETDPRAVLDDLAGTAVDCVVSAYDLPGTTGLALFESVREAHPTLPFVLFPAAGDESVASRALSAGVTEYVRHTGDPEAYDRLADRIREAVVRGGPATRADSSDGRPLEQFSEVFPDVAFAIDETGRYVDLLAGGGSPLLSDDATDLLGERFVDLFPAETAERFLDVVDEALETGDPQRLEYQLDVRAGERWFEARVGPLGTWNGRETVFWVARDITAAKRRQREYEQIFDSVNDAIVVFDPETREFVDVNAAWRRLVGCDDLERIRELGIEGFSAADEGYTGDRGWELIAETAESGDARTVEWRAETVDGDRLWLEATLTPAEVGGEERVLSIQRDVTERKRRQREYEQIFDGVNDAIAVHDPETGELLDANRTMCELTGYDEETLLELGAEGLLVDDPAAAYGPDDVAAIVDRVAAGEEIEPYEQAIETRDGERLWLEVNPTRAVIGGAERFLAISRDVTGRKRREQRLEVFNRVLRHNLRNQVDVIVGHAEVLGDRTDGEHADRIVESATALAAIGDRARTIDRVLSGDVHERPVDLGACLRETLAAVDRPDAAVDVSVAGTLPEGAELVTDERVLTAVFESALENAVTYADGTVDVAAERAADGWTVVIADDGPGIPQGELDALVAGTETPLQHGRGLGLWQLKWGVEKIDGRLSFDTDGGTTVRIELPDRSGGRRGRL